MKSGSAKPYSIGQLHTMLALAPARGEGNIAKGCIGQSFECDANLLKKVERLHFPVDADVITQQVMQYGKQRTQVLDILPVETVKKVA